MSLIAFRRYVQHSKALRRVSEIVNFVTYREVREFDFARAEVPGKDRPAKRES